MEALKELPFCFEIVIVKEKTMGAKKKRISKKPKVPQEVYKGGMLHYTITDFIWISGGCGFKRGWFPIKKMNMEHPDVKKLIGITRQEQEEIRNRGTYRYPHHV